VGEVETDAEDVAVPDADEVLLACVVLAEESFLGAALEQLATELTPSRTQAIATAARIRFELATTCTTVAGRNHEAREANLPGSM
jgi:hypothetical protein